MVLVSCAESPQVVTTSQQDSSQFEYFLMTPEQREKLALDSENDPREQTRIATVKARALLATKKGH